MVAKTFSAQVVGGQLRYQEPLDAFEGQVVYVTVAAASSPGAPSPPPVDSDDAEPPEWMAVEKDVYVRMPFSSEILKDVVILEGGSLRPCVVLPEDSGDE